MREITVLKEDEGQRLNKFLMRYLSDAPSSFIYKMLRKKNIVLNGGKARGDELVKNGDTVKLYLSDETIEKFRREKRPDAECGHYGAQLYGSLEILYEDEDILAVNKPVGMLSQKAARDDISINELIVSYYNEKGSGGELCFRPSVCNRLDRNTSGIILAGISLRGSRYLSKALRERSLDKYYFTVVCGELKGKLHHTAYISKDEQNNMSTVIDLDEYERLYNSCPDNARAFDKIETEFSPLSFSDGYTLLKVKLITGKSHQIRAQLAHLGYFVIGDAKYGDVTANRFFRDKYKLRCQLLHAGEVVLENGVKIVAPVPDKFKEICDGLALSF